MMGQRNGRRTVVFAAAAVLAVTAGVTQAAEVYRTVDADGNVTYTDQPPGPGAEPLKLRELSVVERPEYHVRQQSASRESGQAQDPGEALRQLRREYQGFRLVSPTADQSFWGTSNAATVAWDAGTPLAGGMKVRIYVDDQPVTTTTQALYNTPRLDRGEHRVRAELLDAGDQVVTSAGPVTFFIHQATVNQQRRIQPRGD